MAAKIRLNEATRETRDNPSSYYLLEYHDDPGWIAFEYLAPAIAHMVAISDSTALAEPIYLVKNDVILAAYMHGERITI